MDNQPAPAGSYKACRYCSVAGICGHPAGVAGSYRISSRHVRAGELLHSAESPVRSFLVLCEGSAKSCQRHKGVCRQVTGFHLPGELVSFETLVHPSSREDVVALEPGTVREIVCDPESGLQPEAWSSLLGLLRSGAALRRARLRPFAGRQTAGLRLAAWLRNLVERCQQRGLDPREQLFRMTRADIGSYLGLAKETVCRFFVQFQRDGLIEQRGRRFVIRRPEAFLR